MGNIWSFLLQTLTASGVAVLLLAVKTLFRDKLPPRWQFAIWGILGVILLIPAGLGGRYVLFNWPLWVEALRTLLTGEYAFTRVQLPFPVPKLTAPADLYDWLYLVYFAGVLFHLAKYLLAYPHSVEKRRHNKPVEILRKCPYKLGHRPAEGIEDNRTLASAQFIGQHARKH